VAKIESAVKDCSITFAVAGDLVFDQLNDDLEVLAKERRAGR
jgi:hypothetical protein